MLKKNFLFFIFFILFAAAFFAANSDDPAPKKIPATPALDILYSRNFLDIKDKKVAVMFDDKSVSLKRKYFFELASEKNIPCKLFIIPVSNPDEKNKKRFLKLEKKLKKFYPEAEVILLGSKLTKPEPSSLKTANILIIDLQLNGLGDDPRCSMLAQTLESAKAMRVPVLILDRPNPISGLVSSGLLPEANFKNAMNGYLPILNITGMTTAELADTINRFYGIECKLNIIPMENYSRIMTYKDSMLPFKKDWMINETVDFPIYTSDKSANIIFAVLHSIINAGFSCAQGTSLNGKAFGAPGLNSSELCKIFCSEDIIQDVIFEPITFTPKQGIFKNEKCSGVKITSKAEIEPLFLTLKILRGINKLDNGKYSAEMLGKAMKNPKIITEILSPKPLQEIIPLIILEQKSFSEIRLKTLIYKE